MAKHHGPDNQWNSIQRAFKMAAVQELEEQDLPFGDIQRYGIKGSATVQRMGAKIRERFPGKGDTRGKGWKRSTVKAA